MEYNDDFLLVDLHAFDKRSDDLALSTEIHSVERNINFFANHYGTAVMPARVRRPQDKGKVESGVRMVERWILAVLRNRTLEKLQILRFIGIYKALTEQGQMPDIDSLSFKERLGLLVDRGR